MKTYYVMMSAHGYFQDRYEVKVKAKSSEDASRIAASEHNDWVCSVREVYHVPDKKDIRTIKSMRKHGAKWSEIAWHLQISVGTVKKYWRKK